VFSFEPKLTFDGVMTLAAGIIAYLAALRQIRHADSGLQRQLDDEKAARKAEYEREKVSYARAILSEIDCFYVHHLLPARKAITGFDPARTPLPLTMAESQESDSFPVYFGGSARIGILDPTTVSLVVHFYSAANTYLAAIRAYDKAMEAKNSTDALKYLKHAAEFANEALKNAYLSCRALSEVCAVKFERPHVEISSENLR
jgi:hypothetical protein